jgi:hypothetical protein
MVQILCKLRLLAAMILFSVVAISCGSAGSSDAEYASSAELGKVSGALVGSNGDQSTLANWAVVLIERDTGITRVAIVDSGGIFHLNKVNMNRPATLVLLTADFKLNSVLALSSPAAGTIRQFFTPQANLPKLVQRGQIVTFVSEDSLTISTDVAADADADLIPDGLDPDALALRPRTRNGLKLVEGALNDFDRDGVPDIKDPDIDADGIPNAFDTDADGDGIPNVFDVDANGNIVNDATEAEGSQFFKEGLEFIAVQVERAIEKVGTVTSTVTVNGKLRDGVTPLAVDVRGAPSLFSGATVNNLTVNAEGLPETISSAWDKRLLDDGKSNDGAESDRVFARKVELQTGKTPKTEQVLFIRLAFGDISAPWFIEYPYTFPDVTTKDISVTYDKTLKRVTLVGSPYGTQKSFTWYVDVIGTIDEQEGVVHSSSELNGEDTTTYVLPDSTLESGGSYKIRARAQAKDKVPSYPAYIVTSPSISITYE